MAEHYCTEHQTVFFKKGKMRGYAHPIKMNGEDTGEWCNEDAQEVAKLPSQPHDEVLPEHQREIDRARKEVTNPREVSIEQQVAIKEIGECWRTGKLKDGDPLVVGYQFWLIDRLNYKGDPNETVKADSKTETGEEVSEDEGTQTVLDEGELTLGRVRALLDKNNIDKVEWWANIRKTYVAAKNKTNDVQIWKALDDSQKGLAIGGLK